MLPRFLSTGRPSAQKRIISLSGQGNSTKSRASTSHRLGRDDLSPLSCLSWGR